MGFIIYKNKYESYLNLLVVKFLIFFGLIINIFYDKY